MAVKTIIIIQGMHNAIKNVAEKNMTTVLAVTRRVIIEYIIDEHTREECNKKIDPYTPPFWYIDNSEDVNEIKKLGNDFFKPSRFGLKLDDKISKELDKYAKEINMKANNLIVCLLDIMLSKSNNINFNLRI